AGHDLELRGAPRESGAQARDPGNARRGVSDRKPRARVRALGRAPRADSSRGRHPLLRQAVGRSGGSFVSSAFETGEGSHFMKYWKCGIAAAALALVAACVHSANPGPVTGNVFASPQWDDGKAEFSTYVGTTSRYGQDRATV